MEWPPRFALDDMIAPPAVVLSHDYDVLNGNDYITQAIRIYRISQPLGRGRLPKFGLLPTIAENFLDPHRYHLKDLLAMMEVEQRFGFRSVLYVLNGTGGRFGARSDHRSYSALIEGTPTDANLSDGADGFAVFSEMFTHLKKVGGVLSLLFHPGTFANPEKPALTGLYARVLQHLRENGARNYLPRDIVRIAGDLRSGRLLPTEMMAGRLDR
jgi:hypothetical protein